MTGMTILNYAKWCFSAELAIPIIATWGHHPGGGTAQPLAWRGLTQICELGGPAQRKGAVKFCDHSQNDPFYYVS